MKASERRSPPTPRGSPSSATTRCCSSHEDPAKVARANKANSIAYQPALEKITGFDINWNIVAYPTASWAKRVFPGDEEDVAVGRLAEAIFSASRVDNADPVQAWATHNAALEPPDGMAERAKISRAPLFGARERISPSASPTATTGRAARRRRRTASPAIRTSRPRRCSPRPMRAGSTAMSPAPSRSPIRAR